MAQLGHKARRARTVPWVLPVPAPSAHRVRKVQMAPREHRVLWVHKVQMAPKVPKVRKD
jgi:hypothetical protein